MMPTMFAPPPMPAFPSAQTSCAQALLRYEDAAQDGRILALGVIPAIGWAVWKPLLSDEGAQTAATKQGLIPILSRLVVTATEHAFRIDHPVTARGGYQLARDTRPETAKLYLNMWAELSGRAGRLFPPTPAGDEVVVGRVFAEHTWTRPFAPPDQRRVTELNLPGYTDVPIADYPSQSPHSAGQAPADAAVTAEALDDALPSVLGLDHTDQNQHVNSLVYPRLFIDAALRRRVGAGLSPRVLVRSLEIAFRKPSFAGDQVVVNVGLFSLGGRDGAFGSIRGVGESAPRCLVRLGF